MLDTDPTADPTTPVVGAYWTDPAPRPTAGVSWCLDEHDPGDGRLPLDCTRPAGHPGDHVAGGEGTSGDDGRPRRLKVYGVWS